MVRFLVILFAQAVFCQALRVEPGSKFHPTQGEVWPKPQYEKKQKTIYSVDRNKLEFKVTKKSCQILTDAIERAKNALHKFPIIENSYKDSDNLQAKPALSTVNVELTQTCEDYPYHGMDESYNLTVSATATLRSASIWGILHGLESFLHLVYLSDDYKTLLIRGTEIQDYPRHPHRGLLLDTSRHYLSVPNLLITLDALAINKFNVFHWHIIDDPAFPYQSEKFPELSEKGAYHSSMVYTKADIKKIVEYARVRGIRVIPEIDVPGHVRSWGEAYPQILTECYSGKKVESLGPLNPIKNQTYKLLGQLLEEVREWFPDKYLHLGGDEVDTSCWSSNPSLLDYMQKHNMSSVNQFQALFMERTKPLVGDRKIIVWEEVFHKKVPLSNDILVQIWRDSNKKDQVEVINEVVNASKSVIFSNDWYLSMLNNGGDWQKFYFSDPRQLVRNKTLVHKLAGGEACMWGEFVDDRNFLQRVWPRASAIAERLWSEAARDHFDQHSAEPMGPMTPENQSVSAESMGPMTRENQSVSAEPMGAMTQENQPVSAEPMQRVARRLEEHACRMLRRGVPAQPPNGPGFCIF